MSERKIVVPEGMLDAAIAAYGPIAASQPMMCLGLQAALRWLTENPIVPTRAQMKDVEAAAHHEPLYTTAWLSDVLVEWQRRMFLAPELEDTREMTTYDCLDCKKSWKQQLDEFVARCVYCQSINTKRIATCSVIRWFKPEPEVPPSSCPCCQPGVPEQVRGLLFRIEPVRDDANKMIIEAFRRGQRSPAS